MKFELQDRIDDYLLNRMSDEERVAFEQEVANDKELKEQLEFTQDVQQAISRNEKLAAMKEWENDYVWKNEEIPDDGIKGGEEASDEDDNGEEVNGDNRDKIRRIFYWVSGIAAVFVAGLMIFRTPSDIDPNGMLREGDSYAYIDTLILHEQYQEALTRIEEEIQVNRNDSIEYVQNSLMSEEALDYKLICIKERQDDLKWQTVLALLGMDRKDEALTLLNELRKEKGPYKKDAKALYKLVKKQYR